MLEVIRLVGLGFAGSFGLVGIFIIFEWLGRFMVDRLVAWLIEDLLFPEIFVLIL